MHALRICHELQIRQAPLKANNTVRFYNEYRFTDCQPTAFCAAKLIAKTLKFFRVDTMVHIMLMYYINIEYFFNQSDANLKTMLEDVVEATPYEAENQQGVMTRIKFNYYLSKG